MIRSENKINIWNGKCKRELCRPVPEEVSLPDPAAYFKSARSGSTSQRPMLRLVFLHRSVQIPASAARMITTGIPHFFLRSRNAPHRPIRTQTGCTCPS